MTRSTPDRVARRKIALVSTMSARDCRATSEYAARYRAMTGQPINVTPLKFEWLQASGVDMENFTVGDLITAGNA